MRALRSPTIQGAAGGGGRATVEWLLVAVALVLFFLVLPHQLGNDDNVRFADIEALLHHGTLTSSRYSLVMPLASVPFLLMGEIVGSSAGWAARFNVIVVALAILVVRRQLRGRDDSLLRSSLLVLLCASYLTNRLRDYDAEIFTGALVTIGIVALSTGRGRTRGWWAIVVGAANTPAAIVGVALLAVHEAVRLRRLRELWPIAATALLVMTEAWIRRGSPFDTGYGGDHGYRTVLPYSGRPGFSYPFVFGLLSILFAFGRGLVFFFPGLFLWFHRPTRAMLDPRARTTVGLLVLFTIGFVLVYAKWWAWYGGVAFGPRFFVLAAVPASVLLAARLRSRPATLGGGLLTLAILAISTWVAVVGIVATVDAPPVCTQDLFAYESLCWYSPELSPLGQPFVSFPHLTGGSSIVALYCLGVVAYLAAPTVLDVFERLSVHVRRSTSLLSGWKV